MTRVPHVATSAHTGRACVGASTILRVQGIGARSRHGIVSFTIRISVSAAELPVVRRHVVLLATDKRRPAAQVQRVCPPAADLPRRARGFAPHILAFINSKFVLVGRRSCKANHAGATAGFATCRSASP